MKQRGFTLIEIIVSLVLMGIIGLFIGQAIYRVVQSYIFAKSNVELTEKAQLALTRMSLELQYAGDLDSVSSPTSDPMFLYKKTKYSANNNNETNLFQSQHWIYYNKNFNQLELNGKILLKDINNVTFNYRDKHNNAWQYGNPCNEIAYVDIAISLKHPSVKDLIFKTSISLRNNGVANTASPISTTP